MISLTHACMRRGLQAAKMESKLTTAESHAAPAAESHAVPDPEIQWTCNRCEWGNAQKNTRCDNYHETWGCCAWPRDTMWPLAAAKIQEATFALRQATAARPTGARPGRCVC